MALAVNRLLNEEFMNYRQKRILIFQGPFSLIEYITMVSEHIAKNESSYTEHKTFKIMDNYSVYTGCSFERKLIQDISEAKSEILILSEFINEEVLDACIEANFRGISVFVLYDSLAIKKIGGIKGFKRVLKKYLPGNGYIVKPVKHYIAAIISAFLATFFLVNMYLNVKWDSVYDTYALLITITFVLFTFSSLKTVQETRRKAFDRKDNIGGFAPFEIKMLNREVWEGSNVWQDLYLIDQAISYIESSDDLVDKESLKFHSMLRAANYVNVLQLVSFIKNLLGAEAFTQSLVSKKNYKK